MNRPLGLMVLIVATASACSTQTYSWVHPEKDSQQFDTDNSSCLAQGRGTRTIATMPENSGATAGGFSSGWATVPVVEVMEVQKTMHRRCMKRKGWRLQAD